MNTKSTSQSDKFPIGGPRLPVYNALRGRGFVQSGWSDKHWTRRDGFKVHIYGTGSKLAVYLRDEQICDGPMDESLRKIDDMDRAV